MKPKITIITATFNSEEFIESCMNSVLSQDYENIEYLIIDGVSKDKTLQAVNGFIKNNDCIRLISEPDFGIYDALNKGIKNATGDIIGFVHSDDVLSNTTILSTIANEFISKNIDGVYGDLEYVDKKDLHKVIRLWKSQDFEISLLKKGWMPAHPTVFLKREVYQKYGIFDMSYKIAADYDFMLRIFSETSLNFKYVEKVFTKMRIGGASNRSFKNILQKSKEDYKAVKRNHVGGLNSIINKNVSKIKQFILK